MGSRAADEPAARLLVARAARGFGEVAGVSSESGCLQQPRLTTSFPAQTQARKHSARLLQLLPAAWNLTIELEGKETCSVQGWASGTSGAGTSGAGTSAKAVSGSLTVPPPLRAHPNQARDALLEPLSTGIFDAGTQAVAAGAHALRANRILMEPALPPVVQLHVNSPPRMHTSSARKAGTAAKLTGHRVQPQAGTDHMHAWWPAATCAVLRRGQVPSTDGQGRACHPTLPARVAITHEPCTQPTPDFACWCVCHIRMSRQTSCQEEV